MHSIYAIREWFAALSFIALSNQKFTRYIYVGACWVPLRQLLWLVASMSLFSIHWDLLLVLVVVGCCWFCLCFLLWLLVLVVLNYCLSWLLVVVVVEIASRPMSLSLIHKRITPESPTSGAFPNAVFVSHSWPGQRWSRQEMLGVGGSGCYLPELERRIVVRWPRRAVNVLSLLVVTQNG